MLGLLDEGFAGQKFCPATISETVCASRTHTPNSGQVGPPEKCRRRPQTGYRLSPAGNSICGNAATKSPRKALKSPPWARHFQHRSDVPPLEDLFFTKGVAP